MPIPDRDKLWAKLEETGESEVRVKLASGVYGKWKVPLIKEWLRRIEERSSKMTIHEEAIGFERKVATIFRALGAKVEHDVSLAGNQIDILVSEETPSGSIIRSAIECKYYLKPVGVSHVNSFAGLAVLFKNRGLIDNAILVTRSGFTKQARSAAKEHGIELYEIEDIEQKLIGREEFVAKAENEIGKLLAEEDKEISMNESNLFQEFERVSKEWAKSNYPYYMVEGFNEKQKAFLRHPPYEFNIAAPDLNYFFMVAALHYGGNWYYWVQNNANNPNTIEHLIKILSISYQRVYYRILYSLQLFDKEKVKNAIEVSNNKLSNEILHVIDEYVLNGRVIDYLQKLKKIADEETIRKVSIVIREITQYCEPQNENINLGMKKIFISYNHNDSSYAKRIKKELEDSNINIMIDIEDLKFGDKIDEFIAKSVKDTNFTVSIISKNSLLSPWVILESLETFMHEHVNNKMKFLPIIIDESFFDNKFQSEAIDIIEKGISDIIEFISKLSKKYIHTTALENKKARLIELRNNFDKILNRIYESFSIDFTSDKKIAENLPKLIKQINN